MANACTASYHVSRSLSEQSPICWTALQDLHSLWFRVGVAHVFIEWNHHPVLLPATRLLANRDILSQLGMHLQGNSIDSFTTSGKWRIHFFSAHAVRARGFDGHQNVLWWVNYSQVVRNRWNAKSLQIAKTKQATKQTNTNTTPKQRRHPEN